MGQVGFLSRTQEPVSQFLQRMMLFPAGGGDQRGETEVGQTDTEFRLFPPDFMFHLQQSEDTYEDIQDRNHTHTNITSAR